MTSVRLSLLGAFSCTIGGREVTFPTRGVERLLAYLILKRGRPTPRRTLAGTLWPDSDDPRAAKNLNTTLWRAKGTLADRMVTNIHFRSDHARISLEIQDAEIDAIRFQDFVAKRPLLSGPARARELNRAMELYGGDFLEGLDDEWIVSERAGFRSQYLSLLRELVDTCIESTEYSEGLIQARRLLELDPLDEGSHRRVMLLRFLSGDRSGALMQYRLLTDILSAELGIEPSQESRDLWLRMRSSGRAAAAGFGDTKRILGVYLPSEHRQHEDGPVVISER
jgi:DNA-binding SARP family transcriptional activator